MKLKYFFFCIAMLGSSALAYMYLRENFHRLKAAGIGIPSFLKIIVTQDIPSSDCAKVRLEEFSPDQECYDAIENLNRSEILLRNTKQSPNQPVLAHSIHLGTKDDKDTQIYEIQTIDPLAFACGENKYCTGVLIDLPLGLNEIGAPLKVTLTASYEMSKEFEGETVVFFPYSEALISQIADTGWNFFDHPLHAEPETGDLIFLNDKFEMMLKEGEKQPRVAHNRSIFPGVGGWPGEGKRIGFLTPRLTRSGGSERRMDYGGTISTSEKNLDKNLREYSINLLNPKRQLVRKMFVGVQSKYSATLKVSNMHLSLVKDEVLLMDVLSLSPLEFDFALKLLDKHRCPDNKLDCLRSIIDQELLSYLL